MPERVNIQVLRDFREAIACEQGGEIVLRHESETGRVFFVEGKIAWAAVSTVKRTFLAFLVDNTDLTKEELVEVFQACKTSGGNFGETIVEWDLLEESTLRGLLLEHLSECLLEIFTWTGVESMFVPEQRSYKGSFTFDLQEVVESIIDLDQEGRLPFGGLSADELMTEIARDDPTPGAIEAGARTSADETSAGGPTDAPEPVRQGGRTPWIVGVLAVAALVIGGLTFNAYRSRDAARPTDTPRSRNPGTGQAADAGAVAASSGDAAAPTSQPAAAPSSQPVAAAPSSRPARGDAGPPATGPASRPATAQDRERAGGITVGAPGQGLGSVRVESRPGRARVYLDGLDTRRKTPYKFKALPAGVEHVIMLHRPRYGVDVKRFKLAPNMEATLRFTLKRERRRRRRPKKPVEPISVRIETTPPGAAIRVNRKLLPLVTPADVQLDPRRASRVDLRLGGFRPWRGRIRPVPGVPLTYALELKPRKKRRVRRRRRRRHRKR